MIPRSILRIKIKKIAQLLSKEINKTELEALKIFYSSQTYETLLIENTLLWTESNEFIVNEVLEELKHNK